jgi:hypothetical protein
MIQFVKNLLILIESLAEKLFLIVYTGENKWDAIFYWKMSYFQVCWVELFSTEIELLKAMFWQLVSHGEKGFQKQMYKI